ncbi:MAG: phytanoyl-CoA dioxygenase family protein [Proteobacteria bacterium]|nr:phytanoyl-CoA dioxygenase family protein [Pseudomonadota bacterium]
MPELQHSTDLCGTYQEQGYLVVERLFSSDEVARLCAAVTNILETPDLSSVAEIEERDPGVARRIWSPTKHSPVFAEMASDPRMLNIIEQLIGPDILLQYTKVHMKPPRIGSKAEWHQDFAFYPHTNTDMVTAMVCLDDHDRDNACLHVVPGSHKRGMADHYVDGHFRGMVRGPDVPDFSDAFAFEAPRGSVIFLHCLMLHGSPHNHSLRQRRAFFVGYRAADAFPIYWGPHSAHNEPSIKVLRGNRSKFARVEAGHWHLPYPQRGFGSLFELQSGTNMAHGPGKAGYSAHELEP